MAVYEREMRPAICAFCPKIYLISVTGGSVAVAYVARTASGGVHSVGVTPPPQSKSWSVTWYVATCRPRGRETGQENKAVVFWPCPLNLLWEQGPTIAVAFVARTP